MKLRKVMLLAMMTAAIGSMNMFAAFADGPEDAAEEEAAAVEESYQIGWVGSGSIWRYYDNSGNAVTGWIKADGGDGRGNEVWYYVDPSTGVMVYNETKVIDGVGYTFGEDGSWVAPTVKAPKGRLTGGSFYNTWSNLRIEQTIGNTETDREAEDQYVGEEYSAIGSPKLTHDLYMSTDFGDLEIFYADMKSMPELDAATFASNLAGIEKGSKGTASAVETVTVANQEYSKVSVTGKKTTTTFYCRKQDGYMVVICTSGSIGDASAMADIVNSITTAQ